MRALKRFLHTAGLSCAALGSCFAIVFVLVQFWQVLHGSDEAWPFLLIVGAALMGVLCIVSEWLEDVVMHMGKKLVPARSAFFGRASHHH